MDDIYKEIDDFVSNLKFQAYNEFAEKILQAKHGGSMASEILGRVSNELKNYEKYISSGSDMLQIRAKQLKQKIDSIIG